MVKKTKPVRAHPAPCRPTNPLPRRPIFPRGVVVYGRETTAQAFRRAELETARACWQQANAELTAIAERTPWWDDILPDGRT